MEEAYSFQVVGQAKEHIMYVTGGQLLQPNVESLLPMVTVEPDEGQSRPPSNHWSVNLFIHLVEILGIHLPSHLSHDSWLC